MEPWWSASRSPSRPASSRALPLRARVRRVLADEAPERLLVVRVRDAREVQVVLYNDETTPMAFVADVLQAYFDMSKEDAAETMLEIYRNGKAVCGLYSRQDGEELVRLVLAYAKESGHPLACAAVVPKEGS